MLSIRPSQLSVFQDFSFGQFVDRATAFSQSKWPERFAIRTKEPSAIVYELVSAARGFGFETEQQIIRFLNIAFALGGPFWEWESFAWSVRVLESRALPPSARLDRLVEQACLFLLDNESSPDV